MEAIKNGRRPLRSVPHLFSNVCELVHGRPGYDSWLRPSSPIVFTNLSSNSRALVGVVAIAAAAAAAVVVLV